MHQQRAAIEIAAPPEVVRAKFLDFPSIPKYHNQDPFFISITPKTPNKFPVEVGDVLINHFSIGTFEAPVVENNERIFKWAGGLKGIFLGAHEFHFEPSTKNPGGTLFVQQEEFTGAFAFVMGDNAIAKLAGVKQKSAVGWEQYNKDFKAWVESAL